jgi:hypothetical protein
LTVLTPWSVARSASAFVPSRWWRRRPFLPVPDRALMRFRMETAYGTPDARPPRRDLKEFLSWTVAMRRLARTMPPRGRFGR